MGIATTIYASYHKETEYFDKYGERFRSYGDSMAEIGNGIWNACIVGIIFLIIF